VQQFCLERRVVKEEEDQRIEELSENSRRQDSREFPLGPITASFSIFVFSLFVINYKNRVHYLLISIVCGVIGLAGSNPQQVTLFFFPHQFTSNMKFTQLSNKWRVLEYCTRIYIYMYIHIYRVSQEERARLREGVPYAKIYRYNPKHLCPKLNGYGDNGQ